MTVGDRRCARGRRCAAAVQGDEAHLLVGALLTRPEGLCPACVARLERTVRQVPQDIAALDALIGEFGTVAGPHVRRTRELSINIRPGIDALRRELAWEIEHWAEALGMETPTGCRLNARVARSAAWVGPRIDEMLALGPLERTAWTSQGEPIRDAAGDREVVERTGLDGALKLLSMHQRVRQVTGRTVLVHKLTPCCPYCDQPTLVRRNGADQVECENPDCAKAIKEQHYDWFVQVTIAEERRRQAAAVA